MAREKFESGEKVRLDADFNNTSIVEVVEQTLYRMFTRIRVYEALPSQNLIK